MHRAHHIRADGIGRSCSCNTEIRYFYFTVHGNNNVLRLHITMYDSMTVSSLESHRYLNGNTGCFLYGKLAFFGDILLQSDPFDQLHYNIVDSVIIAYIKYIYNIGMSKPGCCLSFLLEFLDKGCVFPKFRFQHFYCNKAVEFMIFRLVYIRHSAGSDLTQYFVALCYDHSRL